MELRPKKLSTQIVMAVLFGILLNVFALLGLAYVLYIREHGRNGMPLLFEEFLLQPKKYFPVLIVFCKKKVHKNAMKSAEACQPSF